MIENVYLLKISQISSFSSIAASVTCEMQARLGFQMPQIEPSTIEMNFITISAIDWPMI